MFFRLLYVFTFTALFSLHAFAECPKKIASLTLASDEILVDILEDRSRIAALTYLSTDETVSNIVDKAKGIKKIRANIEQVIALEPDLVITASYTNPNFLKQLENTEIETVFLKDFSSFDSIKKNIMIIGKAVCERNNASSLVGRMENRFKKLSSEIPSGKKSPEVLYYSASGNTAGRGSLVNEIIQKAGGVNLADKAGIDAYGKISLEYIINADPDVIILSSYSPSDPDFSRKFISKTALKDTSAFQGDRVKVVPAKHLISASHYAVKSVEDLIELFNETYWKDDPEK